MALPVAELVHATPTTATRLSPSTMDSVELLRSGNPSERIAAADSLKYAISEYPLNPVLNIWYAAKDMIETNKASSLRIAGWDLLTECAKHASSTDLERKEFFQTLSAPANPEDFHLQLAALVDLTRRGRVLDGFDYELLPLLTRWLQDCYKTVRTARKNASHSARSSPKGTNIKVTASGEDQNFAQLFAFITDVIKFSFKSADDMAIMRLIDAVLNICTSTSAEQDLRSCVAILDTVVTFGSIPDDKLKDCVKILSSIYSLVPNLAKDSWHTLSNFCKSHNGQATVRILLDIMRSPSEGGYEKDKSRAIKGALAVMLKLLSKASDKGYPPVPYSLLVDGLQTTVNSTPSPRILTSVLEIINVLFSDHEGNLHRMIIEEDWTGVLHVAADCCMKGMSSENNEETTDNTVLPNTLNLIARLEAVISEKTGDFVPRQTVIDFFVKIHWLLPDATAATVLDYLQEFKCCSPSDPEWEENLSLVLGQFFGNRERSSEVRLRALQIVIDAYEILDLVGEEVDQSSIPNLAKRVLEDIAGETDAQVLGAVSSLMVSVGTSCEMELFEEIIGTLHGVLEQDRLRSSFLSSAMLSGGRTSESSSDSSSNGTPSNVVTHCYIKMFAYLMNSDSLKSTKLFDALVQIAHSPQCAVDARVSAMKLLFRLRADWAYRVYLTKDLETTFLANTMCRTEESLARKQAEETAQSLRHSRSDHVGVGRGTRTLPLGQGAPDRGVATRSLSATKAIGSQHRHIWKLPDSEAIPATISSLPSPVLVSCSLDSENKSTEEDQGSQSVNDNSPGLHISTLNTPEWLKVVLNILKGSEWEVYSFVLVHLPSQLSNHAIFKEALPQIQELRKLLCEIIHRGSFQEPPLGSGPRQAEVVICLYHSLTMILSYHDHFQKGEEDEIVQTFILGIGGRERVSQCCIHALSICCHELPLSTSKLLLQMLGQMSLIITQPDVAMHILEFLSCLSRLRDVYVNFRDEDFKVVFGISFRYLDYAREKRQAGRGSVSNSEPNTPIAVSAGSTEFGHPTASDDLPQYVYSLAYHVIIFWFLALKLQDRAGYVNMIAKRLLADVDGSGQMAEEQALTTIDFMQRVAYADVDESVEDPLFKKERFGDIAEKRWLIGNSIVSIKQSLSTGWAQVMKRQPSYTSVYTVREAFRPPPSHQTRGQVDVSREGQLSTNVVLPSHLLIQLMSQVPQSSESARPIPLPDDDAIDRMLRVFDRNPTVDGHKVGVVYIGEGQTNELDILANVSGSRDYLEFLNNLGTLTKLKGANFNTQGLDRDHGIDGEYTFAWRDRLTEIVFHVVTQMPTDLEHDPQLSNKKRHIGNDFVNIIFNDSGHPFNFDTFPSQFNFVNIVITPASRASFIASRETHLEEGREQPFYRVQVMSKPGFPEISPASETKMISLKALPDFIRLIALNASVFSLAWQNRTGREHFISPWRCRLREIRRLREKYAPRPTAASTITSPSAPPISSSAGVAQQLLHHPHGGGSTSASGTGTNGAFPLAGGGGAAQQQQSLSLQHQQPPQQAQAQTPHGQALQDMSRPTSGVRESFTSLRRTSVATFFTSTSTSEQPSHRSSVFSGSAVNTNDSEMNGGSTPNALDALVDSIDFSRWG